MIDRGFLHRILFLDIETVPLVAQYEALSQKEQELFEKKTRYQRKEGILPADFYDRAGIWAEFGKVICISAGYFKDAACKEYRLRSFYAEDERLLLCEFKSFVEARFSSKNNLFCAHNGKEFDFPYLARRMLVNRIVLPDILNLFGKKPWEVRHLDTMELWKFGDYKHYTSLELLSHILGIPSPKNDGISGSEVAHVYYRDRDIRSIVKYCEQDTIALTRVYLRFINGGKLLKNQITRAD